MSMQTTMEILVTMLIMKQAVVAGPLAQVGIGYLCMPQ